MARLPAVCPNGHLYADPSFVGGDGSIGTLTITNSSAMAPCPACRRVGRLIDGTYEMVDGIMGVLGRPEWTSERMSELQAVIDERDPVASLARIEAFSPALAAYLRWAATPAGTGATASHLMSMLSVLISILK